MTAVRILLVDDERSLSLLLQTQLVRLGYQVEAAASAEEALAKFEQAKGAYQLLLVDVSLPGMTGDELMLEVLDADPNVRVLLTSGYPFDMSFVPEEHAQRVSFLQKPFMPQQLGERVKALLDQPQRS
jgi:DNA-binding NtrC family response regulator